MKTWKHKTRRGLAGLLALVMCLGLQIPAFAVDTDAPAEDNGPAEAATPSTSDHTTTTVPVGDSEITVENEVTPGTPTTTWGSETNLDDGTNVTVNGSETTTETDQATTVAGSETVTVTEPEKTTEGDAEFVEDAEVEWDQDDDGSGGWTDRSEPPADPEESEISPEDWVNESELEIKLTQEEDGNFSGSTSAVDWEKVQGTLKGYGLSDTDLTDFNSSNWEKTTDNGTVVTVENGKITIVETDENEAVWNANSFTANENAEPASETSKLEKPDGDDWTEVKDENGVTIGYRQTVDNGDGTTTTTVKKLVTETTVSGAGTVTQHRIVTTTTIDLNNAAVAVKVELSAFEEDTAGLQTSEKTYGNIIGGEVVKDPRLNAIAEYGYWGDTEEPGKLDSVIAASKVEGLSGEDAKAATQAALLRKEDGLSEKAKAFYEYLMKKANAEAPAEAGETENTEPAVEANALTGEAAVKLNGENSAEVSFIVSLALDKTGDLVVTIINENGEETTENLTAADIVENDDGTYTVTLTGVKFSDEASVNLKITTTETVTEREVYEVTTTVTETQTFEDKDLKNGDKIAEVIGGNIEVGNKNWNTYNGYTADYSYNPDENEKNGDSKGITITPINPKEENSDYQGAVIKNPTNKDIEVKYIAVKAKNGYIVYEVPGGILHKDQSITVESVAKSDGRGIHGISHICLIGIGEEKDPATTTTTETSYGMKETTNIIKQSADLVLNLILGSATMTGQVQDQDRTGTAAMTRTDTTTQTTTRTVRNWSSEESKTPETPEPEPETPNPGSSDPDPRPSNPDPRPSNPTNPDPETPPEVEVPDEDVPLEELPPAEPPEEIPPELPEPVEIPEEEIPLVEIPDTKVPLADAPKAKKPAADAPKAKKPAAVTVEDTKVPLADVPKTGDSTSFWAAALALSVCGLAVLTWKKDEDETV